MFFFEQYFKYRNRVKATFTRASAAYKQDGSAVASGIPRIENSATARGIMIEEGTTNLLPTGAENFVTGWSAYSGEVTTVTDYPVNIPGIGDVIAKRITGNGAGSSTVKRLYSIGGRTNPHTDTVSVWAMVLSGNAKLAQYTFNPATITGTMQRLSSTRPDYKSTITYLSFNTNAPTDILDIVVYAPQIENKAYATSYTPPGTTRAEETFSIPVNAYQKNLLTLNQATGGDTLGDTTGFLTASEATITRVTTESASGTGSIQVSTPGSVTDEGVRLVLTNNTIVGKIYTCSAKIKGSGVVKLQCKGTMILNGPDITLTESFVRYQAAFTCDNVNSQFRIVTSGAQAVTFHVDDMQFEEGTTASDWALPEVDYTNAIINPTAGTIEFDYTPTSDDKSASKYLFGVGNSTNYLQVYTQTTSGYYALIHRYNSGTSRVVVSAVAVTSELKKSHKFKWLGTALAYWIDGVLIGTTTYDGLPSMLTWLLYFGGQYNGATLRNGSISNVRISSIARTDEELAYTGTLKPDRHTTYYRDFTKGV